MWPLARFRERESDGDRHINLVLSGKSAGLLGWLFWKAQTYREDNIKIAVKEVGWELWIRFIWLIIGNVFLTRKWTFGFNKVQGIPCFGYYGPDIQPWLQHSTRAKRILFSYLHRSPSEKESSAVTCGDPRTVSLESTDFWASTQCRSINSYDLFGIICCFCLSFSEDVGSRFLWNHWWL
jgi:hypothetical protein